MERDTENRETFIQRCEVLFPHTDCVRIMVAYDMAKGHHGHQTRKSEFNPDGTPVRYFEHPRRVALILMDEVGVTLADSIVEALLHDSYEDTKLGHEGIAMVFGVDVSKHVLVMSKKPKQGFERRLHLHASWRELIVKLADRIDNMRTMGNDPAFRTKTLRETDAMYLPLTDLMMVRVPKGGQEEVWCTRARDLLLKTLQEEKARA